VARVSYVRRRRRARHHGRSRGPCFDAMPLPQLVSARVLLPAGAGLARSRRRVTGSGLTRRGAFRAGGCRGGRRRSGRRRRPTPLRLRGWGLSAARRQALDVLVRRRGRIRAWRRRRRGRCRCRRRCRAGRSGLGRRPGRLLAVGRSAGAEDDDRRQRSSEQGAARRADEAGWPARASVAWRWRVSHRANPSALASTASGTPTYADSPAGTPPASETCGPGPG
jgi:hypothetical protein